MKTLFLKTKNGKIVSGRKSVQLRGINLGGWLMMEAYFLHSPHRGENQFRKGFKKKLGERALDDFDHMFRSHFIQREDLRSISRIGMNCVRLPFHYRLIESKPYTYDQNGLQILDRTLKWAKEFKIKVILDLHAAPGSQNHDWHSDSNGQAKLWTNKGYQKRVWALWEFLADRYKDNDTVAGYDLLNESVLGDPRKLNAFYKQCIRSIRSADKNHILFIEGNHWAMDINCLDRFDDNNYCLSVHHYEPIDMTFNYVQQLRYPLKGKRSTWNRTYMKNYLMKHKRVAKRHGVPVLVGEFGVNARGGIYGEDLWLKDALSIFNEFGFHWTYWTYKAIKNNMFPDGLYSYYANPPWVNRAGPLTGWETYAQLWRKHKKAMARSWRSSQFSVNREIMKVLKNAV